MVTAIVMVLALVGSFFLQLPQCMVLHLMNWGKSVRLTHGPVITAYNPNTVDWVMLRRDLENLLGTCGGCGPILIRLSWHDAGTFNKTDSSGGPRALQRLAPGSTDPAHMGLDGARSLLQAYKTRHPAVGYADLWALAAVTAVKAMGGPDVPFRAGRIDGTDATPIPVGQLPDASQGANHLRAIFYRMGFSDADIVALSGAHTVGRCHADRTGYSGQWTSSPLRFDSEYFKLLLNCDWKESPPGSNRRLANGLAQMACSKHPGLMMLPSDYALATDPSFRVHVESFAEDQPTFFKAFASAFQRMQELGHEDLKEPYSKILPIIVDNVVIQPSAAKLAADT